MKSRERQKREKEVFLSFFRIECIACEVKITGEKKSTHHRHKSETVERITTALIYAEFFPARWSQQPPAQRNHPKPMYVTSLNRLVI